MDTVTLYALKKTILCTVAIQWKPFPSFIRNPWEDWLKKIAEVIGNESLTVLRIHWLIQSCIVHDRNIAEKCTVIFVHWVVMDIWLLQCVFYCILFINIPSSFPMGQML